MAQKKAAASFNEMIQADRQKRKNEQLAQEIFGKNRRQSAPTAQQNGKKAPLGGSLASRVGVTKADGRLLHVFLKDGGTVAAKPKPTAAAAPVETTADDSMEIDNEQSEAREAADREREQRRGRDDRDRRPENGWPNDREFPTGGRGGSGGGGTAEATEDTVEEGTVGQGAMEVGEGMAVGIEGERPVQKVDGRAEEVLA
ncbi:hypothetical protein B0A48_03965 [Cryoendolithus antarcticus]|uniref:Uncharacterized protein n=1 Tax=Cryoendolithus antarcticus TaxID=1507870 RepID=A0A1V8TH01_9PEZI|nr:hypothetical protein B0A48_03965 [Cryoendolithus antarcticus]